MRRLAPTACACVLLAAAACTNTIDVRTVVVPEAVISGRMTFRILPAAELRGRDPLKEYDPMLPGSVTFQAMRSELRRAFEKRGYRYDEQAPDMDIAYYATAAPRLDLLAFDYRYGWGDLPVQFSEVNQFDQGTVIIDVIAPATRRLLWRGQFNGSVDPNPPDYVKELRKAIGAIVGKFPMAGR